MATEEQTAGSFFARFGGGIFWDRVGQRLTITNRVVSKLAFKTKKAGSPTGTITFTIRKLSDESIIVSKVFGSAAAVSSTAGFIEVTFDHPAFINEAVRILMEWSGTAGDVDNYLEFWSAGDVKASEFRQRYDGSYTTSGQEAARDATYRYTYIVGEDGGSGGGIVYPTQAITRVTNMIHRYVRANGLFILELQLGEVTTDFGIPQWLSAPQPAVARTKADEFKTIEEAIDSALKDERVVIPSPRPLPRDTDLPPIEKPGQIPKREPKETLPRLPRPFPELPPIEKPSEFPKEIDRGGQVPRLTDEPVITKPGRIRKGTSGKASKRKQ